MDTEKNTTIVEEAQIAKEVQAASESSSADSNSKQVPDFIMHYRNAQRNWSAHQRKVLAKRRAADKNAKKARKLNRKH